MEPDRLAALARELGDGHAWFACDVTDQAALTRAVDATVVALGGIDVVMANAGIASHGTVRVSSVDALLRVLEVNLGGVVRTVHAALPHVIERRGYVLIVSSAAAFTALPGMSTYAASKAGVEQFANVLRLEVMHLGVQVGLVHPSWVDTDLVRDVRADMASFERALCHLSWPFGTVSPLATCADRIVSAIETRARRIYVPRVVGLAAAIRQVAASAPVQGLLGRRARELVPLAEQEARTLGREFGRHSVGLGSPDA
jgi:short-subunit dehydrogenase